MKQFKLVLPSFFLLMSFSVFGLPEKNMVNSPEEAIAKLETMLEQYDRENLEKEKGSKLKFGEKVVASVIRKKIKKKIKRIEKGKDDGLAIGSLALGGGAIAISFLAAVSVWFLLLAGILAVAGLTIGIIAKKTTDSPLAKTGIILNSVIVACGIFFLLFLAFGSLDVL